MMKGFPDNPEEPMGKWYKAVNARIAEAAECTSEAKLLDLLGEPDNVEGEEVETPSGIFAGIGSILRFGQEHGERVLTYVDPYRPRFRYMFSIVSGKIDSHWRVTVDDSRKNEFNSS
jgi:hypothetical protein